MNLKSSTLTQLKAKAKEIDSSSLTFHNSIVIHDLLNLIEDLEPQSNVELEHDVKNVSNAKKIKILLVDDDPDIFKIIKFALSNINCDLITMANPLEALNQLSNIGPCIIILDFMMPEITGLEFLKKLRTMKDAKMFTVIMMSGKNNHIDRDNCLEAGAAEYLTKPININELKKVIKEIQSAKS